MASLSLSHSFLTKCSAAAADDDGAVHKLNKSSVAFGTTAVLKATGFNPPICVASPTFTSVVPLVDDFKGGRHRLNIPREKQISDPYRQGHLAEGGFTYSQTIVVRSYEVGPDKTATLETVLNLFQETALNHVWMSGLLGDGFGATHGMTRNNLIWVVSRMHVQVDKYPIWGEVVDIETWVGASGKNGMRRDWVIGGHLTGQIFARGTSNWVMMNQHTRRLSKIPEEVRNEISPWFLCRQAIKDDAREKINKLGFDAKYIESDLKPKRNDLDMNHHVNNVKYVRWMLETIPDQFLEDYQLSSVELEYRRECGSSDVVESLCNPDENSIVDEHFSLVNGHTITSEVIEGRGLSGYLEKWPTSYTHLLQTKGEHKNEEIVRGRTMWRKKASNSYI